MALIMFVSFFLFHLVCSLYFFNKFSNCISYYTHIFSWDRRLGPVHDLWRNGTEIHEDGTYMTDIITREALRFIGEHRAEPFFLYLPYNAPHYPMEAPKKWMDMYEGMETNRRPYAAMISCLDDSIGQIVAKIKELGLLEDTLFLFASDNGPSNEVRTKVDPKGPQPGSSGPSRGSKFSLLEGGIRMPFIAAWKGRIRPGTVSDEPAIAMDILPTIAEAVFARCISAVRDERVAASKILRGPRSQRWRGIETNKAIAAIRKALYASKVCSYAQGFALMREAGNEYGWSLDFGEIAMIWRGGCIIRARFLHKIKDAFDRDPALPNLLLDPYFQKIVEGAQKSWRLVVSTASQLGIPIPAFSSALCYFDSYRRPRLSANLIQAQRDYFGAHTYERLDKPGSFHTEWLAD